MSFLYLTRTVHMPVTADGCAIKNSFGVVISTAVDPVTAAAMADLINLGRPAAEDSERRYDADEAYRAGMLSRSRRKERCPMSGMPEDIPESCPLCGREKHTGCGRADLVELEG